MPLPAEARSRPAQTLQRLSRPTWLIATAAVLLIVAAALTLRHGVSRQPRSSSPLLAVIGFRDLQTPQDPVAAASVASLVGVGVLESDACRVVAPEYLAELSRRRSAEQPAWMLGAEALALARGAGASHLLCGDLGGTNMAPYVAWRLLEVDSGRTIGGRRDEDDELIALADRVVAGVVALIQAPSEAAADKALPSLRQITTTSSRAYELYIAGRLAAAEGHTLAAVQSLQKAIALDSTFALAHFELSCVRWPTWDDAVAVEHIERAWKYRAHLGAKDQMRVEARRSDLNGHSAKAIQVYRRILERWPDDREALVAAAQGLQYFWFNRDALLVAKSGIARYPDDPDLDVVFRASLANVGHLEEAIAATRKSLARRPDDPILYDDLGRWLLARGMADSAEVVFEAVLSRDPLAWYAHEGVAQCAYARGDLERAIAIERAILQRPDLAAGDRIRILVGAVGIGLIGLYVDAGRIREALETIDQARDLASRPGSVGDRRFANLRQTVLSMGGRPAESLAITRDWLARDDLPADERWEMEAQRAFALIAADSLVQARESVARLRRAEPFDFAAYHLRTYTLAAAVDVASGDPDRALAHLQHAQVQGVPQLSEFDLFCRLLAAQAHRLAGRLEEAAEECGDALRIYGSSPLLYRELAEIEERRGRLAEALAACRKWRQLRSHPDPDLPELATMDGRLNRLQQRLAKREIADR